MNSSITMRARTGFIVLACAALVVVGAIPANATTGAVSCGGSSETTLNGNQSGGTSLSATTNYSLQCGGVGHMGRTNVNGQLLWSSSASLVSGKTYNSRTYYGAIDRSRHYHNGTYNTLIH